MPRGRGKRAQGKNILNESLLRLCQRGANRKAPSNLSVMRVEAGGVRETQRYRDELVFQNLQLQLDRFLSILPKMLTRRRRATLQFLQPLTELHCTRARSSRMTLTMFRSLLLLLMAVPVGYSTRANRHPLMKMRVPAAIGEGGEEEGRLPMKTRRTRWRN